MAVYEFQSDYEWTRDQAQIHYKSTFGATIGPSLDNTPGLEELRSSIAVLLAEGRTKWDLDWRIGLSLARCCTITPHSASNPRFWWRLNISLAPDLLRTRWGISPMNYESDSIQSRVFDRARNYLGSLWWLVRILSTEADDFDSASTCPLVTALSRMSTDSVVAIIERTGGGYPRDLLRSIVMKQYASDYYSASRKNERLLRQVMKLNNAWLLNVVPELTQGGVDGYVSRLFGKVHP